MARNENYELKAVCVEDIFNTVKLYTNRFETEAQFTQWTKSKVYYTQVPFSRKRQQSGVSARKRDIYVLKPEFYSNLGIVFFMSVYLLFILYCRNNCK